MRPNHSRAPRRSPSFFFLGGNLYVAFVGFLIALAASEAPIIRAGGICLMIASLVVLVRPLRIRKGILKTRWPTFFIPRNVTLSSIDRFDCTEPKDNFAARGHYIVIVVLAHGKPFFLVETMSLRRKTIDRWIDYLNWQAEEAGYQGISDRYQNTSGPSDGGTS